MKKKTGDRYQRYQWKLFFFLLILSLKIFLESKKNQGHYNDYKTLFSMLLKIQNFWFFFLTVWVRVCVCIYIYINTYLCIYLCVYICVYIKKSPHKHIYNFTSGTNGVEMDLCKNKKKGDKVSVIHSSNGRHLTYWSLLINLALSVGKA